ncbi:MAG: hypothetical protein ACHP8A_14150 [Terriglobales bacterium]
MMNRPTMVPAPKLQGELKHNFEAALEELHDDDPKAVTRHMPIVQRSFGTNRADPRTRALAVAATSLATLWGV